MFFLVILDENVTAKKNFFAALLQREGRTLPRLRVRFITEEAEGHLAGSRGSNPCPVRAASRREAVKLHWNMGTTPSFGGRLTGAEYKLRLSPSPLLPAPRSLSVAEVLLPCFF
ncbi:hypothetical protein CDG76_28925 [Nostoc sp. 'Peltigera membranacea cyanobiont' 210A]|nr:hypothetical protein CDG76_28925 [Nostoc sp. 'Peltigera membranacea cyanobiont' 210A]